MNFTLNKYIQRVFREFKRFCYYPFVYSNIAVSSRIVDYSGIHKTARIERSCISAGVTIGEGAWLHDCTISGHISIGRFSTINGPSTDIYTAINYVNIGHYCSVARGVVIQEYNHWMDHCSTYSIFSHTFNDPTVEESVSKGPIIIGHDVWIGTQSIILSGVNIGNGAIIGANSVVTSNVPPYAIVGGSPARVLGYRFSESIREKLLEIQWWHWSVEKIKRNRKLFEKPLTEDSLMQIL